MRFLSWLKELFREEKAQTLSALKPGSFLRLDRQDGSAAGAVLVHDSRAREAVVQRANGTDGEKLWRVSDAVIDQICCASSLVASSLNAGQLLQVVGSPAVVAGLESGKYSLMAASGGLTGTALSTSSGQIVGQLRFAPAGVQAIVAPVLIWQVLHAVAGVRQLAQINKKLELLQERMDDIVFRQQAKAFGPLAAAMVTLEEYDKQYRVIGRVTSDMTMRLTLATRDIRAALWEQRTLIGTFNQLKDEILQKTQGKKGAKAANDVLKGPTAQAFLVDARVYTYATRASLLATQAWLLHDLDCVPDYVGQRHAEANAELEAISSDINVLAGLEELQEHAESCVQELGLWRRLFSKDLVRQVDDRRKRTVKDAATNEAATIVAWKESSGSVMACVLDLVNETP